MFVKLLTGLQLRLIRALPRLHHPARAMNTELASMRVNYDLYELTDETATQHPDPLTLFQLWLKEAIDGGKEIEPNAMTLATVSQYVGHVMQFIGLINIARLCCFIIHVIIHSSLIYQELF